MFKNYLFNFFFQLTYRTTVFLLNLRYKVSYIRETGITSRDKMMANRQGGPNPRFAYQILENYFPARLSHFLIK